MTNSQKLIAYAVEQSPIFQKMWHSQSHSGQPDVIAQFSSDQSGLFFFRFGVVVCWNLPNITKESVVQAFENLFSQKLADTNLTEHITVIIDPSLPPKVEWGQIVIDTMNQERAEVIARTVAQSVALECMELHISRALSKLSEHVDTISSRKKLDRKLSSLQKFLFESILIRKNIVSQLSLLDKPDILWNDKTMDLLYTHLQDMFDIDERFSVLQKKMHLLQDSLSHVVEIVRERRVIAWDFAIVILFIIALLLMLFYH